MMPKAPKWEAGLDALKSYKAALDLYETSLRSKTFREFYRKDLKASAKRYRTLADKRPEGSEARAFFLALSDILERQLDNFAPEPAPKKRPPKVVTGVPLEYPNIPDHLTLRCHFPEAGSLKRDKASAIARHAAFLSRQVAPSGDVLLSVAVNPSEAMFFEHLIEAVGADRLGPSLRQGAFAGWARPDGSHSDGPDWEDERSPWVRIQDDNAKARLYHWSPRRADPPVGMAFPDVSWIPDSLPWDPDPRFRKVLEATQQDDLEGALRLAEAIPAIDREPQFDEMLYLRFLTGSTPRADDLRYLARKYISNSSLQVRLEAEFEDFVNALDAKLVEAGPITKDLPGFEDRSWSYEHDPSEFVRNTPSISDWPATRKHYRKALDIFGHPITPRGRFFIWHPDICANSMDFMQRAFAPQMVAAENVFRRNRGIPEIGCGWISEVALYDLVRSICPDAIHQWRPFFLGQQSVDIYIPSLKLAIEYQGPQHYEAVALFGGEEGFAATRTRDQRKRAILETNGIRLVEWHYATSVTEANVKKILISP